LGFIGGKVEEFWIWVGNWLIKARDWIGSLRKVKIGKNLLGGLEISGLLGRVPGLKVLWVLDWFFLSFFGPGKGGFGRAGI